MKLEQTECFETSAYKIQTPQNSPEESIQHSEHGEILKSRTYMILGKSPEFQITIFFLQIPFLFTVYTGSSSIASTTHITALERRSDIMILLNIHRASLQSSGQTA
jgi:hypothetical protein